jgi:hypothetical protein
VTARHLAAYEKMRPAWTRNETMRWLNDRSALALAWLRRSDSGAPTHSANMGRWLKELRPELFSRAHSRLSTPGLDEAKRSAMAVMEVLR